MAYVQVPNPKLDVNKPGLSTDWKQIRDNQDYHESRINELYRGGAGSVADLRDHFISKVWDSNNSLALNSNPLWETHVGGSGTLTLTADHYLDVDAVGTATTSWAVVAAREEFLRVKKSYECVAYLNTRIKRPSAADDGSYFLGWTDDGLAINTGDMASDVSDCVGLDLESDNWIVRTGNGGSSSTGNITSGTTAWHEILVLFTCSATGGNRKVEAFLDGGTTPVTLATDANMPTVLLRPVFGVRGDGTFSAQMHVDYIEFGFMTRPLNA